MKKEIQTQIDRIERQIAAEQVVYKSMKQYTDSEMKTVVINQQIGVVRGLEVAKESLNYLLERADNRQLQLEMPADEWMATRPEVLDKMKRPGVAND